LEYFSEDPIGFEAQDPNLSRYVGNGPTNALDPQGLADVNPFGTAVDHGWSTTGGDAFGNTDWHRQFEIDAYESTMEELAWQTWLNYELGWITGDSSSEYLWGVCERIESGEAQRGWQRDAERQALQAEANFYSNLFAMAEAMACLEMQHAAQMRRAGTRMALDILAFVPIPPVETAAEIVSGQLAYEDADYISAGLSGASVLSTILDWGSDAPRFLRSYSNLRDVATAPRRFRGVFNTFASNPPAFVRSASHVDNLRHARYLDNAASAASVTNPRAYSSAFEMRLPNSVLGKSRSVHFNRANAALHDALAADAQFAGMMDDLIPGVRQSVSSVGGRQNPIGWTWEHVHSSQAGGQIGTMRLVPTPQHTPGSPWWRVLHPQPGAAGGYSEWAIPRGAPPN